MKQILFFSFIILTILSSSFAQQENTPTDTTKISITWGKGFFATNTYQHPTSALLATYPAVYANGGIVCVDHVKKPQQPGRGNYFGPVVTEISVRHVWVRPAPFSSFYKPAL